MTFARTSVEISYTPWPIGLYIDLRVEQPRFYSIFMHLMLGVMCNLLPLPHTLASLCVRLTVHQDYTPERVIIK